MVKTHRSERTTRRPSRGTAKARLTKALETLTLSYRDNNTPQGATVTELCRLAEVSRNALYRYHTPILKALRKLQCRRPTTAQSKAVQSAERQRLETVALREHISKLVALVDHHYSAYRETATLLERRDRELAELRGRLKLRPTLLKS